LIPCFEAIALTSTNAVGGGFNLGTHFHAAVGEQSYNGEIVVGDQHLERLIALLEYIRHLFSCLPRSIGRIQFTRIAQQDWTRPSRRRHGRRRRSDRAARNAAAGRGARIVRCAAPQ
jgi:hypothetical protein